MEKNNDTQKFENKQNSKKDYAGIKSAGMGLAGAAVGSTATAITLNKGDEQEPISPTPNPNPDKPEPKPEPVQPEPKPEPDPVVPEPEPDPIVPEPEPDPIVPEPDPNPIVPEPEPDPIVPEPDPNPEPVPEPDPEQEDIPYVPAIEIDPNDNDVADIIQDVTSLDVIRDVNGNEMLMATAHNAEVGEFYLVDMDVDGDFDVILDGAGIPVQDLIGDNDKLITMTDLDVKVSGDDYVEPNEIDELIAQNNSIGEDMQVDIIEV